MKHETYFIGIDLGKQTSYFVVKNEMGILQKQMKLLNDLTLIKQFLEPFKEFNLKAVMEATTNYYWMYQTLKSFGCEVVLAHPLKTRAIADAKVKNDRIDS